MNANLLRLQVRPRAILLGPVPVLRQRWLAQQGGLIGQLRGFLLQDGHQRPARRAELNGFQEADPALLVNDRFDRPNHTSLRSLF
ncbi:MAG TPA: hypothetical protein VG013_34790 [Gemmataceae bacterium]|nr:hypothetical protein [Gemmataceae bacterium]